MEQEKPVEESDANSEETKDMKETIETEVAKVTDDPESQRNDAETQVSKRPTLECLKNITDTENELQTDKNVVNESPMLNREKDLSAVDNNSPISGQNDFDIISTSKSKCSITGNCKKDTYPGTSSCSHKKDDVVNREDAMEENAPEEDSHKSVTKDESSQDKEIRCDDSIEHHDKDDDQNDDLLNGIEGNSEREEELEWPSEDFHTYMLEKICRICAGMTVVFSGPGKGVPKAEMVRSVKKIWKVDLSDEDPNQYPVNVCLLCERKIKRLYLKVSKKKKCEMFRTKPAEFEPHRDHDCPICLLKDADTGAQNQDQAQKEESANGTDDKRENVTLEPRRNPARKRGWPDHEPPYKSVGCQADWEAALDTTTGLEEHDYIQDETGMLDQNLVLPKKHSGRTPYHKLPLSSVNAKYIRQDRLKPLISHIDKYCQSHKENKVEVMFFLLTQALRDAGDRSRESAIVDIWTRKGSEGTSLTEEECLAKRILLKQTKEQYRKEYTYYKEKLEKSVLKPPFIIDKLEKTYFPEHLEYYITERDNGPVIYKHEKMNTPSYFPLQESVDNGSKGDGVMGIRWRYFDAVAKTLEEFTHTLENDMQDLEENSCIHVDLSDYCEEKKDMTHLMDKMDAISGKRYHSKMITYLFCVQSLQAVTGETVHWTYNKEVIVCRPLMKALVSDASALRSSMLMVEEERNKMASKYFHITAQNGTTYRFLVFFSNEAPEVRRDYR